MMSVYEIKRFAKNHKLHTVMDVVNTLFVFSVIYAQYTDMVTTTVAVLLYVAWAMFELGNILVYFNITRPLNVLQSFMNQMMMEKCECNCCDSEEEEEEDEE